MGPDHSGLCLSEEYTEFYILYIWKRRLIPDVSEAVA